MPRRTLSSDDADKLDRIIELLDQMNRRDRLRTIGGVLRTIIFLVPVALALLAAWYFATNFDAMISTITQKAAEQAAGITGQQGSDVLQQLQQLLQAR